MKRDLYAEVSTRIVAELEAGAAPWVKPWSATAGMNTPCNAVTNRPYSGCNVLLLWMAQTAIRQLRAVFLSYAPTDLTSIRAQYTGGHSHRRFSPIVGQRLLNFFPHHPFNTDKLCVIFLSVATDSILRLSFS